MAVNPGLEGKAHKVLQTPSEFPPDAVTELATTLTAVLVDAFALYPLYLKSKSPH